LLLLFAFQGVIDGFADLHAASSQRDTTDHHLKASIVQHIEMLVSGYGKCDIQRAEEGLDPGNATKSLKI